MPGGAGIVLIVEDEAVAQLSLKVLFESLDFTVRLANNGQQALDILMEGIDFDLVLLDWMMPGLSGLDVCYEIRKRLTMYQLPILMLTALSRSENVIQALEYGANDFISKPYSRDELIARSRNLIHLKRMTSVNLTLKKALDLKDQLIRMAAHDIKNPIHGIINYIQMLQSEISESPSLVHYSDAILRSAKRIQQNVNNLLEFSRIESHTLILKKKKTDLVDTVIQIVDRNQEYALNKRQHLCLTPGRIYDAPVYADTGYIDTIIDNLVNNAIKYSPYDSRIDVTLTRFTEDDADWFRVAVKDRGPGLAEYDRDLLFRQFQKLGPKPTGGEISTGLGLAIAKKLSDLHNARLYAESSPGQGSSFFFEIKRLSREI